MFSTPEGLQGGPPAEIAMAAPEWHKLWARGDVPAPGEQALRDLLRELPPFHGVDGLTRQAVAATVRALPMGRAPGPDGWSAACSR